MRDAPEGIVGKLGPTDTVRFTALASQEVEFTSVLPVVTGEFSGIVETASLPAGEYRVWARACLESACGPAAWVAVAL